MNDLQEDSVLDISNESLKSSTIPVKGISESGEGTANCRETDVKVERKNENDKGSLL